MATLITTDNQQVKITPKNGCDFTLEELYQHIGCELVEIIYLNNPGEPDDLVMIGDEEARLKDASLNALATDLYQKNWDTQMDIVGNVILCQNKNFK
jgi:hypothetical protein